MAARARQIPDVEVAGYASTPQLQGSSSLVVRARVDPERIEPAERDALAAVDPTQPQFHVQPMDAYVSKSVAQPTFTLTLGAACGAAAFLLATSPALVAAGVPARRAARADPMSALRSE